MNILDKIIAHKEKEVEHNRSLRPIQFLESSLFFGAPTVSLKKYLCREDKHGIIAEFKRRSPSKPAINIYADIEKISIGYMQAGASALSVLTDQTFFGALPEDLPTARKFNFCPILRKDFIFDEYQILEARSMGADAVLLIAEVLDKTELKKLAKFANSLKMEVLMELHSSEQLDKCNEYIDVIGVNNRDLTHFTTDISHSIDLFSALPKNLVKIAESGIHSAEDLLHLSSCGYDGFLIGERFMSQPNPVKACQHLIKEFSELKSHAENINVVS